MITLKNSEIDKLYGTLLAVDNKSTDLDFSVKFKNKANFKILKEHSDSFVETINDIYKKYGKEEQKGNKQIFNFIYEEDGKQVDNSEIVKEEKLKLLNLEVELDLKAITIDCKEDPKTGKTDTKGLIISSVEMETLESIFKFNFIGE